MKIEHEDYILEIEEVKGRNGEFMYYKGTCEQLPYFPSGIFKVDLDVLIRYFQQKVDNQLASDAKKAEEEKALDELVNSSDKPSDKPKLKISLLTSNGKVINQPCHIREDGCVECEPFTEENTIVGSKLKVESKEKFRDKVQLHYERTGLKSLREHCRDILDQKLHPRFLILELEELYQLYGKLLDVSLEDIKRVYFLLAEEPE